MFHKKSPMLHRTLYMFGKVITYPAFGNTLYQFPLTPSLTGLLLLSAIYATPKYQLLFLTCMPTQTLMDHQVCFYYKPFPTDHSLL